MYPETDAYVQRRYTDLAVTIHTDIKQGRGLHNHYSHWLEDHLKTLSVHTRENGSLMNTPSPVNYTPQGNTWTQAGHSGCHSDNCVDSSDVSQPGPSSRADALVTEVVTKNAWGNETTSQNRPVVTESAIHTSKLCTIL